MYFFAKFLTSWLGTVLWCGGTVFLAVYAYLRLRFKVKHLVGSVEEARKRLVDFEGSEGFCGGYHQFSEYAKGHHILGHLWTEFAETLILPRPDERRQVIRNSVEAGTFFNLSSILEGRLNLRVYRDVSNYLPGLGILGTFVGLTAGIYLAQSGLATNDIGQMRNSLGQLLNGASLAFWTSIVGLVCSLIYSPKEKKWTHKLQQEVEAWCDGLDARLDRVTLEQVSSDQLTELRIQTEQLQRFNTDLAVSISSALDERLAGRFAPLLERSLAAMEGLRQDRQQTDQEFIGKMVEQFGNTFTGAAGTEMTALSATLADLTAKLQDAASSIAGAGSHVGKEFETATRATTEEMKRTTEDLRRTLSERQRETDEAFQGAMLKIAEQVNRLTEAMTAASGAVGERLFRAAEGAGGQLREAAGAMGKAMAGSAVDLQRTTQGLAMSVDRMVGVVQDAEHLTASTSTAIKGLEQTIQSLSGLHASMRESAEPLALAGRALTEQLKNQERLLQESRALQQELSASAASVEASGQALRDAWQKVHGRFEEIDGSLNKAFSEINRGVEAQMQGVRGFVQELDKSFSQATQILSGAIQELGGVVEDLSVKK